MIVPDCREGFDWAHREVYGVCDFAVCGDFRALPSAMLTHDDLHRPIRMPVCKERDRTGVRAYSWCHRCPAGFIGVNLDARDARSDRDSAHFAL